MSIYLLMAYHTTEDGEDEPRKQGFRIGIFRSKEICNQLIDEYRKLPGFSLPDCSFEITEFQLPESDLPAEYVFCAEAVEAEFSDYEKGEIIGYYLTKAGAMAGIIRYLKDRVQNQGSDPFEHAEMNIYLQKDRIGQKGWQEGFVTETYYQDWDDPALEPLDEDSVFCAKAVHKPFSDGERSVVLGYFQTKADAIAALLQYLAFSEPVEDDFWCETFSITKVKKEQNTE